ncbi:hypothetical protein GF312_14240 [Candidatus Poribacteria bacterium]|nr:hypothetical protein [Candidatus Poribacteria bacterium]
MKFWKTLTISVIFCMMVALSSSAAPIEGVVLYLPFDEGEGDTAEDQSGNGNDGALMGNPEWVNGKFGKALQFNGEENTNYVEIPDSPDLNPPEEISLTAWIFIDDFVPTGGIISKYIGAGNQRSYNLHMNHTPGAFAITSGVSSNGAFQAGVSTTSVSMENGTLVAGEWQHVGMTFKASDFLRIYHNGEMKAEADAAATESIFDNNVTLLIGTDFDVGGAHNGQAREFTGIIDEVAIFNRALSDGEMMTVMEGNIMPVEYAGKLASTWASIKR